VTFLKTRYRQTLLLAVTRDGQNEFNLLVVIFFIYIFSRHLFSLTNCFLFIKNSGLLLRVKIDRLGPGSSTSYGLQFLS
jgi:hypothetical protein